MADPGASGCGASPFDQARPTSTVAAKTSTSDLRPSSLWRPDLRSHPPAQPIRPLPELIDFVRTRTRAAPVPLVPELAMYQADELTPLWHATVEQLEGWDSAPFWAFPWAGGQALARYLLDHAPMVQGRRVFDFAAGGGVVALAAARAGAARVVACDVDPFCQAAVHLNSRLNGLKVEFRAGDPLGMPLPGFDLVVAGDVFYERRLARDGMVWLARLASRGARALAGDPGRSYSPTEGLLELAGYDVPVSLEIEGSPLRRTRVLEVLPAGRR
jgi:predicted nicotinamide N-methyase